MHNYILVFMLHKVIKINKMMRFSFPIGSRWKKIDVEWKDKSHVGPQRKEKHVVDLIKMVKKTMGPQRGQKARKEKNFCIIPYLLHWWIRVVGPQRGQKYERGQKTCSFIAQTFFWGGRFFLIHCTTNTLNNKINSINKS